MTLAIIIVAILILFALTISWRISKRVNQSLVNTTARVERATENLENTFDKVEQFIGEDEDGSIPGWKILMNCILSLIIVGAIVYGIIVFIF